MLQATLPVASDGLLNPTFVYVTLSAAVRGYLAGAVVTESGAPPAKERRLGGSGIVRGRTFWDDLDEFHKDRIKVEDDEIMAVIMATTIKGLLE